jgi:very-short-patch-repair endonuclease
MNSQQELSPIEKIFWDYSQEHILNLEPQVWISPYRVDFLVRPKNIVIELDGHEYHSSKQDRTKDAQRERYLQRLGYSVVRFTGTEIKSNPQKCVQEVVDFINSLNKQDRDEDIQTNQLLYCTRMQEVITHLLDKHNIDDEGLSLTLYQEHYDRLSIQKLDQNLLEVCHYRLVNDDVCYDPSIEFAIHFDSYTDSQEWIPLRKQTIFDRLDEAAEVISDGEISIIDYDVMQDIANYAEGWAAKIRMNGWFQDVQVIEAWSSSWDDEE